MTNAILRGKPDAGNPHVRFDEGEVASAKPRRGSLLYKATKIKTVKSLKAGLLACAASCSLSLMAYERGETIVHLSFDNTVDAQGGVAVHSGGTPAYSTDTPASTVYWTAADGTSVSRTNEGSLLAQNKQIQLKLSQDGLLRPNLPNATIEFFIKGVSVENGSWASPLRLTHNPDYVTTPPFPFLLQTDGSDRFTFRADCFDDASEAASSASAREALYYGSAFPFADATWHHVALTVAETTDGKTCAKFYFDYTLVKSVTSTKFAWNGLTDTMTVDFGSAKTDCRIDEFRISYGALEPKEFLSANPPPTDGETLLHLTFDGDLSSTGRNLEQPARVSGTPVYSTADVPGASIFSTRGETSTARPNKSSLLCENRVVYLALPLAALKRPDLASATIEFYIKGETAAANWAVPLRLSDPNTGDTPPFQLLLQENGGSGKMFLRLDASDDGFSKDSVESVSSGGLYTFADGNWHHVAATLEPTADGRTQVRYYVDHQFFGSATSKTQAWKGLPENAQLRLGTSGMKFWIDEFRISKGVLDHTQFLNTVKPPAAREVLVHLPFDGSVTSLGRADCQPTLVSGSPTYSPRGRCHRIAPSLEGGTEPRENRGSLRLDNGAVKFKIPGVWLQRPHLTAATIEFFIKGDANASAAWQIPVKMFNWSNPAVPPFPLALETNPNGKLTVQLYSAGDFEGHYNDSAYYEKKTSGALYAFNDRKWHHVAVTIAPTEAGLSTYTWYVDYEPVATASSETFPWQGLSKDTVLVFEGSATFSSTIDEFRICRGVLSPDEFLRRGPSGGLVIIR